MFGLTTSIRTGVFLLLLPALCASSDAAESGVISADHLQSFSAKQFSLQGRNLLSSASAFIRPSDSFLRRLQIEIGDDKNEGAVNVEKDEIVGEEDGKCAVCLAKKGLNVTELAGQKVLQDPACAFLTKEPMVDAVKAGKIPEEFLSKDFEEWITEAVRSKELAEKTKTKFPQFSACLCVIMAAVEELAIKAKEILPQCSAECKEQADDMTEAGKLGSTGKKALSCSSSSSPTASPSTKPSSGSGSSSSATGKENGQANDSTTAADSKTSAAVARTLISMFPSVLVASLISGLPLLFGGSW